MKKIPVAMNWLEGTVTWVPSPPPYAWRDLYGPTVLAQFADPTVLDRAVLNGTVVLYVPF